MIAAEPTRVARSSQQFTAVRVRHDVLLPETLTPLVPAREELRTRFDRWAEHGRPDGTAQDYPAWVPNDL